MPLASVVAVVVELLLPDTKKAPLGLEFEKAKFTGAPDIGLPVLSVTVAVIILACPPVMDVGDAAIDSTSPVPVVVVVVVVSPPLPQAVIKQNRKEISSNNNCGNFTLINFAILLSLFPRLKTMSFII